MTVGSDKPTVGVAGLGRMGVAIATRLMESRFPVSVWNRSAGKTGQLEREGATVHATPAELAQHVDVIVTMLTDAEAIGSVYRGASGVLAADLDDKLVIEMSTVTPATEIELAAEVSERGGAFVECPVGGTIQTTLAGNLFGLAGGSAEDLGQARIVLDQLCRHVEHVGDVGAGASMKLAINLPLATYWQSLGEAYVLCGHLGIDPHALVTLFAESSAGPNILKIFPDQVAEAFAGGSMTDPPFDCDLLRKDLRTMIADAESRGIDLPLSAHTLAIYDDASVAGWGARAGFELGAYWAEAGNARARAKEP